MPCAHSERRNDCHFFICINCGASAESVDLQVEQLLAKGAAVNVELFRFGEGRCHTPPQPTPEPDVRNDACLDCGLRVGIWTLFDLFDELQVPTCLLGRWLILPTCYGLALPDTARPTHDSRPRRNTCATHASS